MREELEKLKDNSMVIAMEELAELQQAISKMIRYGNNSTFNRDNLEEEIADVMICLEWVKEYYNLSEERIKDWYVMKQERILARMEAGKLK